jgi:hypothetical protein
MPGLKHYAVMNVFWGSIALAAGALVVSIFTDPRNQGARADSPESKHAQPDRRSAAASDVRAAGS